jgi:hypothetical protein
LEVDAIVFESIDEICAFVPSVVTDGRSGADASRVLVDGFICILGNGAGTVDDRSSNVLVEFPRWF